MRLSLMRTTTGKEDLELPLLQRISLLELPASGIAAQINVSQSLSCRHFSTSTVQKRLRKSGPHGQIAAKKPLLKDSNKKMRLAWANKHKQWTLDQWTLVWWVQNWDFWFQPPCHCEMRCEWTDYLLMCISHRKTWRRRKRCYGVGVLCWWQCLWCILSSRHT